MKGSKSDCNNLIHYPRNCNKINTTQITNLGYFLLSLNRFCFLYLHFTLFHIYEYLTSFYLNFLSQTSMGVLFSILESYFTRCIIIFSYSNEIYDFTCRDMIFLMRKLGNGTINFFDERLKN